MAIEPEEKDAIAFVDGQNLFHSVREAYGYTYPNYDILALARSVCDSQGWTLRQVRFYTDVPDAADNDRWHQFWEAKLLSLGRAGVYTFKRALRYRNRTINLPDGSTYTFKSAEEKGIDVRIAVDVVRMAIHNDYDVGVIFSQDQDLSEVSKEIREIARESQRWIKIASAYPVGPTSRNRRGIDSTDWVSIDKESYDACIDHRDYRPKTG